MKAVDFLLFACAWLAWLLACLIPVGTQALISLGPSWLRGPNEGAGTVLSAGALVILLLITGLFFFAGGCCDRK